MKKTTKKILWTIVVMLLAIMQPINIKRLQISVITAQAATAKLSKSKVTIAVDQTERIQLKNNTKTVIWSTSNKNIAEIQKISNNIVNITAKKKGSATITAKVGNKKYICKLKIKEAPKLSKSKITTVVGQTERVQLKNNTKAVAWSISNKNIADIQKISKNVIKITAKKKGNAIISATVDNKKYTCRLKVKEAPKLNATSIILSKEQFFNLKVTGANSVPTWSLSADEIVTSNEFVSIKKISANVYRITPTMYYGITNVYVKVDGKTLTCSVHVRSEGMKFSIESNSWYDEFDVCGEDFTTERRIVDIYKGGEITVRIDGITENLSWKFSNLESISVKKVNGTTYRLKAKEAGSTEINVDVFGIKLQLTVNVLEKPYVVDHTKIMLYKKEYDFFTVAYVRGDVTVSSTDSQIAEVCHFNHGCDDGESWEKYRVYGKKIGTTYITIKVSDRGYEKIFKIPVAVSQNPSKPSPVTIQGVTFDLDDFPQNLRISDVSGRLDIVSDRDINPSDLTFKIANGNAQLLADPHTYNLLESNRKEQNVYQYYVSNWKNMVAYVSTTYKPNEKKQSVWINSGLKTGAFPVSVYYKNKLVATCNVTVASTNDNLLKMRAWVDEIEKKAWTSGMSVEKKLYAIKYYISANYSYEEGYTCVPGAEALLYAARDLGLKARYRFVGPNYDYEKGEGDEYYHLGAAYVAGHVCVVITINGKDKIYEAQGH